MIDLLVSLLTSAVAHPQQALLVLWAAATWHAKRSGIQWWWIGLPVLLLHLYKNRRDVRGMLIWVSGIMAAVYWLLVLWTQPAARFTVGFALPFGVTLGCLVWLAANYGELPVGQAARAAWLDWRSREVVVDAVAASVGEEAKVVGLKDLGHGDFEATVIGPAGMPHDELAERLRDRLAESILRQSGRVMRNVTVVGTGAKGRVRLACGTHDPYANTITLSEVMGQ